MQPRFPLLRALVGEAVDRMERGEPGDRVLDRVLRAHRDLSSDERRLVAEWSFGIALWRGRLDALGGPALRLATFLVDRERRSLAEAAELAGVEPALLEAALGSTAAPTEPVARLAFTHSLPEWLAARWIAQLGEERAHRLAAATNVRGPVTLRANTLRTTREALANRLRDEGITTTPAERAPHALHVVGRANLLGSPAWREGLFEVQDEGSQLVADAVGARPGELVVDLCAGSGGKTLALAAPMSDRGRLVAIELVGARLQDLAVRARRAGVSIVEARTGDASDPSLVADLVGLADRVLVDAPCSSTGVLRRGPDARWRLSPDVSDALVPVQRALLASAATLVRPGGRLVYATCSVDRAENDDVAEALSVPGFVETERLHLAPDTHGTDGFFACTWQRA